MTGPKRSLLLSRQQNQRRDVLKPSPRPGSEEAPLVKNNTMPLEHSPRGVGNWIDRRGIELAHQDLPVWLDSLRYSATMSNSTSRLTTAFKAISRPLHGSIRPTNTRRSLELTGGNGLITNLFMSIPLWIEIAFG